MSGAISEGAGREFRDALVVWSDERAPYNLIIAIICVECGANFHAVSDITWGSLIILFPNSSLLPSFLPPLAFIFTRTQMYSAGGIYFYWQDRNPWQNVTSGFAKLGKSLSPLVPVRIHPYYGILIK